MMIVGARARRRWVIEAVEWLERVAANAKYEFVRRYASARPSSVRDVTQR